MNIKTLLALTGLAGCIAVPGFSEDWQVPEAVQLIKQTKQFKPQDAPKTLPAPAPEGKVEPGTKTIETLAIASMKERVELYLNDVFLEKNHPLSDEIRECRNEALVEALGRGELEVQIVNYLEERHEHEDETCFKPSKNQSYKIAKVFKEMGITEIRDSDHDVFRRIPTSRVQAQGDGNAKLTDAFFKDSSAEMPSSCFKLTPGKAFQISFMDFGEDKKSLKIQLRDPQSDLYEWWEKSWLQLRVSRDINRAMASCISEVLPWPI